MILQLIFIFLARVTDVSMGTIRMILIIRGDKIPAAIIGFFEIMVYTIALGMVMGNLNDPKKLIVFCFGFAFGVAVGSIIEEKLALGFRGLQVTIDAEKDYIVEELRNQGFPVTCWEAQGKLGPKVMMNLMVRRNMADQVLDKIYEHDSSAFVVFMEPKHFSGGYIKKK